MYPRQISRGPAKLVAMSKQIKKLGVPPEIIRKVAIAMYEGEINMVIHANGGDISVDITPDTIHMELKDVGPGIVDIDKAMQAGYSTAPDDVRSLGFGAGMGLPNMKKIPTLWTSKRYLERERP